MRPCDHPDGPPRPETGCAVCRQYADSHAFRAYCDGLAADQAVGTPGVAAAPGVPRTPPFGPGAQLKALLASAGLTPEGCSCNSRAALMDLWGAAGCRAREAEILAWLRAECRKLTWGRWMTAAVRALAGGLAFRLNPLDPAPGLFREALRRADATSCTTSCPSGGTAAGSGTSSK